MGKQKSAKDIDFDMLRNPYTDMANETKELLYDTHRLPNLIMVERIHELEEQLKILKDLLGLTPSQLAVELSKRAVTPNQIRAIIGLDKIETPRTNIIEDILERAEVVWHDDITHDVRVVVSKNPEQPLTPHERQTIYDMWNNQQCYSMKCVFYADDKKGKRILVDEFLGGVSHNASKNKSAKDLAFKKERLRIRKEAQREINELKLLVIKSQSERNAALERAYTAEAKNAELEEWVERLLEYTNLSKSELTDLSMAPAVKKENVEVMKQFLDGMRQMQKMFGSYHPPV